MNKFKHNLFADVIGQKEHKNNEHVLFKHCKKEVYNIGLAEKPKYC